MFLKLYQFWKTLCQELEVDYAYQTSIKGVKPRLVKLQIKDI